MATITPVREPYCAVQLDPRVQRYVEILGVSAVASAYEAAGEMGPFDRLEEYAKYYASRAAIFRARPKLPSESNSFYDELF